MKKAAIEIMEYIRRKIEEKDQLKMWNSAALLFAVIYLMMSFQGGEKEYIYYFEDPVYFMTAIIALVLSLFGFVVSILFIGIMYTNYHFKPLRNNWYQAKKYVIVFGIVYYLVARLGVDIYNQIVWFVAIYDPSIMPTLYIDPLFDAIVLFASIGYSQFYFDVVTTSR
ncbi:MAG: hypothetical protein ACPGO5_00610 [Patescibacteria group bacterium]